MPKPKAKALLLPYIQQGEGKKVIYGHQHTYLQEKKGPSIQGSLVGHTNRSLSFFSWPQLSERPRFAETKRKLALDKKATAAQIVAQMKGEREREPHPKKGVRMGMGSE